MKLQLSNLLSLDDQPMFALETDIQLLEAAKNGDLEIVKVLFIY